MESKDAGIELLFDISKQVKLFYESAIIFVTKKDYSNSLFTLMCNLKTAINDGSKVTLMDAIVDFHLQWLHAVNDIENFKKLVNRLTKDEMSQAISFTIDAMHSRLKYYEKYINEQRNTLPNEIQTNLMADMEIIEEMHEEVVHMLMDVIKCFRDYGTDEEFKIRVNDSVEELLTWLDKIFDSLAMILCKYVNVNICQHTINLTKTLQQIIEELKNSTSPSAQKTLEEMRKGGRELISMIRYTNSHDLEISKVEDKINILQARITRLGNEELTAAVMALQNKKEYLEKRLKSLENLKPTLNSIQDVTQVKLETDDEEEVCSCEDFYQLRIFNHLLLPGDRDHLVTELCSVWNMAIFGDQSHRSIISILSAADIKEEYTDELGTFHIDEHSRKIYKLPDDEKLYQPNENNELVPVSDEGEYVYYYDECGRYFIDQNTRQRVYKAHDSASEYMMSSAGMLLKTKEIRDGVTYYYDNYGRYYVNSEGKNIYREADSTSEFENDGFGNLVRIRSHLTVFDPCPNEENVTEDFAYLRQNVGKALRECIANIILYQPADPIRYLSTLLINYRENIETKDKRAREKEELRVQREIKAAEIRAEMEKAARERAALFESGGSETSYDSNLYNYTSMQPDIDV